MGIADPEGAIKELLPPAWRKAAWATMITAGAVGAYFVFVAGPIASAHDVAANNGYRIDKVEKDITSIKNDMADVKSSSAARDQKMDDLKESMDELSRKMDRLLEEQGRK